jgi:HK97 family phage major capsid protein
MATLATSGLSLPNHLASGLWSKVQTGSTVAKLSGQTPMMFGTTQYMTFTTKPKGEVVAEGANKSQSQPAFSNKTAIPRKVQVTMRFNEEVLWADDDYQVGVLTALRDAGSEALARALDLIAYHGINPLTGVALSGSPAKVMDTANTVEINTATPDEDIDSAVGLILADGFYSVNGIAFDPSFAFSLATVRDDDSGRKRFPELGTGQNIGNYEGLNAAVSTTVSAPEATISGGAYASSNPNVKAIVGDFQNGIRWGVQKEVPIELIRYGDPDGSGDLKRANQIALRLEVVYGIAIMDTDAFAVVKNAS